MPPNETYFEKVLRYLQLVLNALLDKTEYICEYLISISKNTLWGIFFISSYFSVAYWGSLENPKQLILMSWLCLLTAKFGECAIGKQGIIQNTKFHLAIAILLYTIPSHVITRILAK